MRTEVRSAWLLLALLALAPGAAAHGAAARSVPDRFDCRLMDGLQCRAESRAELLAFYGLPTAESRLAAGGEMYRIFIFDAWMKHHVAITVERSPGSPPTLTLHAPPRPGPRGSPPQAVPPLSVPISIDHWYTVRRRGSVFDRRMVPEPVEPGVIRICGGHGPLYFVESTDAEAGENGRLRRSGLGGCQEGLAEPFGIEVALLAAELIPACAELDDDAFSYIPNLMRPLLAAGRELPSVDRLESLFQGAQIDGSGAGQGVRPEQAWLQALAGEGHARFVVERVHARDAGHAVVDGLLRRRQLLETGDDDLRHRVEEAPVRLVWSRREWSDFAVERVTLGAYEPAPDRCNSSDRTLRAVDC